MAANTLDSIKKKMVAMKGDKDSALDKANLLEEKVAEQKSVNEKVSVLIAARRRGPVVACTTASIIANYKKSPALMHIRQYDAFYFPFCTIVRDHQIALLRRPVGNRHVTFAPPSIALREQSE